MKTLPLRELLRQPTRVKKFTAAGHDVRVTDRGKPLWVIQADKAAAIGTLVPSDEEDKAFWRELLEAPPRSDLPSFHQVLIESRR